MSRKLGTLLAIIAVAAGLTAIFRIVVDIEIAIGFVTISFGVLAIIWTSMAINSLSKGSSLRRHTTNFLLCLIFILLFTIWHTLSKLFKWRETINELMLYPGYLFITLAFLIFVITSYQILTMGQEFGFEKQAKQIEGIMEKKRKLTAKKAAGVIAILLVALFLGIVTQAPPQITGAYSLDIKKDIQVTSFFVRSIAYAFVIIVFILTIKYKPK